MEGEIGIQKYYNNSNIISEQSSLNDLYLLRNKLNLN